jgi:hypothetical protein
MDMWKRIGTALCLFLMVGFVACDDDDENVEVFDTNRFFTDFNSVGLFDDWDLDNDNLLNEDEFTVSYYETWDLDNDGILEKNEWDTAVADFGVTGADWDAWDADADGVLEMEEFETGFGTFNYFDDWDLDDDGLLRDREYTDGVFGLWE